MRELKRIVKETWRTAVFYAATTVAVLILAATIIWAVQRASGTSQELVLGRIQAAATAAQRASEVGQEGVASIYCALNIEPAQRTNKNLLLCLKLNGFQGRVVFLPPNPVTPSGSPGSPSGPQPTPSASGPSPHPSNAPGPSQSPGQSPIPSPSPVCTVTLDGIVCIGG